MEICDIYNEEMRLIPSPLIFIFSDLQTTRQFGNQTGRRCDSVPRRLQVLHHHQAPKPTLHPRGVHQSHARQLHSLTEVTTPLHSNTYNSG